MSNPFASLFFSDETESITPNIEVDPDVNITVRNISGPVEDGWTTIKKKEPKHRRKKKKDADRRTIIWDTLATCPHDVDKCPTYREGRGTGEIDPETGELYMARPYVMKMAYFDKVADKVVCRCKFCDNLVYLEPKPLKEKN